MDDKKNPTACHFFLLYNCLVLKSILDEKCGEFGAGAGPLVMKRRVSSFHIPRLRPANDSSTLITAKNIKEVSLVGNFPFCHLHGGA